MLNVSRGTLRRTRNGPDWVIALVLTWALAVGVGGTTLLRYTNTSGRLATPPPQWPYGDRIRTEPSHATLVVFAHPQCPCSRATLEELSQILARYRGSLNAYVDIYAPRSEGRGWAHAQFMERRGSHPRCACARRPGWPRNAPFRSVHIRTSLAVQRGGSARLQRRHHGIACAT